MSRLITLLMGAAAGAAAAHFLDPDSGARRRGQLKDKSGQAKAGATQAVGTVSSVAEKAKGAAISAAPSAVKPTRLEDADDVTLARKVETEIFRDANAPKGDVSVDVQDGVAYLRGAVDDEWNARLADDAKKVDGVKGVKNLLHRPGTPAPAAD